MTLRVRLVAALSLLLIVGLVVFGIGTYSAYSRAEYLHLDDQLRSTQRLVAGQLLDAAGLDNRPGPGGGPQSRGSRPLIAPPGTYAELRDSTGAVVGTPIRTTSNGDPNLPKVLPTSTKPFTVGSATGSGDWRVYASPAPAPHQGYTVVIAVPTSEITASLDRLLLIEGIAGLTLLVLLSTGSWLILRHGLRPLENMATSARSISAGDLSQRVTPADGRSEVGQLGLALNTMLGEIEGAFDEREETEHRLRQFLADASHELRTPLTSIQGFAELFRLGADSEHIDQMVISRRIEEESARMKTLVDDLLLLARLDETRPSERSAVDLAVLAADACSDAVATEADRSIILEAPEPVVVSGDRDHLRQAIANLVTNALNHTPHGSPIEVGAHLTNGNATVVVRDHGPGLDPDALAHVFDRFWQADRARVGAGAGLGLSIVAGIAHQHGGTATATNHPDGGAVFTVEIPVRS
jgi:two-component system OmpR family sensor kinase